MFPTEHESHLNVSETHHLFSFSSSISKGVSSDQSGCSVSLFGLHQAGPFDLQTERPSLWATRSCAPLDKTYMALATGPKLKPAETIHLSTKLTFTLLGEFVCFLLVLFTFKYRPAKKVNPFVATAHGVCFFVKSPTARRARPEGAFRAPSARRPGGRSCRSASSSRRTTRRRRAARPWPSSGLEPKRGSPGVFRETGQSTKTVFGCFV